MQAGLYALPSAAGPVEWAAAPWAAQEGLSPRAPIATPGLVRSLAGCLREAQRTSLERLSMATLIEVIARVVDRWSDPCYHLRREAERLLPKTAGYSAAMYQCGLPKLFQPFRREGLLELVDSELGGLKAADGLPGKARWTGPKLMTQVLAGDLPAVAIESMVRAILLRSATLIKTSSRDPLFPALLARSFAEVDHGVGECLAVLWWKGGTEEVERAAFEASDAVVAYGSEAALAEVRESVPAATPLVTYGHRVSFAAVAREALVERERKVLAAKAAWDVSFFDQQGCVSPHVIFAERGGEISPQDFAAALGDEMDILARRLPRGKIAGEAAAAIQMLEHTWELRQADGQKVRLIRGGPSTGWTVLYEEGAPFTASCLNRVIRVIAVDDLASLEQWLEPVKPHLQTAGLAVPARRRDEIVRRLEEAGVTRVCPIGEMQHPPAAWRHDGRPALLDLVSWKCVDQESGVNPL